LFNPYPDIIPEEIEIKKLKLGVMAVDEFKDEKYKAERFRVDALKENISRNGLVTPLYVTKNKKSYFIKEGGHRFLACKELGYKTIKCKVVKNNE
jgi:ParB-like chromosome segregation protein Spo0J